MDEASVTQYFISTVEGVETATALGYTFFFYGPDRKLPFVTLATQDNEYDRASQLDRPSVFRLDIGVSKTHTAHCLAQNRRVLARTVLLTLAMPSLPWIN